MAAEDDGASGGEWRITVTFVAFASIDGVTFEREIHRSTGDPRFEAVIRFTKTVINPPIDDSLFSADAKKSAQVIRQSSATAAATAWP